MLNTGRANHPGGARSQGEALRAEGVSVVPNEMGELRVDLARYGWFPSRLPSEAAEAGSVADDQEEDGQGGDGGRARVREGASAPRERATGGEEGAPGRRRRRS